MKQTTEGSCQGVRVNERTAAAVVRRGRNYTPAPALQRLPGLASRRAVGWQCAARRAAASRARPPRRRLVQGGRAARGAAAAGPVLRRAASDQARIPRRAHPAAAAAGRLAAHRRVAAAQRVGGGYAQPPSRARLVLPRRLLLQVVRDLSRGACGCGAAAALLGPAAVGSSGWGAASKQPRQPPGAAAARALQLGIRTRRRCRRVGLLLLIWPARPACRRRVWAVAAAPARQQEGTAGGLPHAWALQLPRQAAGGGGAGSGGGGCRGVGVEAERHGSLLRQRRQLAVQVLKLQAGPEDGKRVQLSRMKDRQAWAASASAFPISIPGNAWSRHACKRLAAPAGCACPLVTGRPGRAAPHAAAPLGLHSRRAMKGNGQGQAVHALAGCALMAQTFVDESASRPPASNRPSSCSPEPSGVCPSAPTGVLPASARPCGPSCPAVLALLRGGGSGLPNAAREAGGATAAAAAGCCCWLCCGCCCAATEGGGW